METETSAWTGQQFRQRLTVLSHAAVIMTLVTVWLIQLIDVLQPLFIALGIYFVLKPRPNAAPMRPMRVANCLGVLTSPMYARATAMFPLKMPAKNLIDKAKRRVLDRPKAVKKTVFPTRPIIKTRRRPIRSESDPQKGEEMN